MKKNWLLIVLLISFVYLLLYLKPLYSQSDSQKYGGTVVIGLKGDFDSFNEMNAADSDALQVIKYMLFMSLTRLDENLQFEPYLAKEWHFSDNDSVLTYHLRQDVTWTDGHPTTAKDVVFTYNLATNTDIAYPAASRFNLINHVEMKDDYTVQFHLKKPYPDVLYDTQIPILPKHILEDISPQEMADCKFNRNPIGNGPFKLAEWRANRHVIFEANKNHACGRPLLNRVVFSIIPDENVLLTNLGTAQIDIFPYLTPEFIDLIKKNPQLKLETYTRKNYAFIGWNCNRFSEAVRRAFSLAINKKRIINTILSGFAKSAKGPFLPFSWAYDENLKDIPYDQDMAKKILHEQNWIDTNNNGILDKEGDELSLILKTNAGNQIRHDLAVMIQAHLSEIGVNVQIKILDWNLFIDQIFQQKNFDAVVLAWDSGFTVDPTPLWHSDSIENGYNFISYSNPTIDRLIEQARFSSSRQKARPLWSRFQEIIIRECPYTFLYIPENIVGINDKLRGYTFDARGFLSTIHQWYISL